MNSGFGTMLAVAALVMLGASQFGGPAATASSHADCGAPSRQERSACLTMYLSNYLDGLRSGRFDPFPSDPGKYHSDAIGSFAMMAAQVRHDFGDGAITDEQRRLAMDISAWVAQRGVRGNVIQTPAVDHFWFEMAMGIHGRLSDHLRRKGRYQYYFHATDQLGSWPALKSPDFAKRMRSGEGGDEVLQAFTYRERLIDQWGLCLALPGSFPELARRLGYAPDERLGFEFAALPADRQARFGDEGPGWASLMRKVQERLRRECWDALDGGREPDGGREQERAATVLGTMFLDLKSGAYDPFASAAKERELLVDGYLADAFSTLMRLWSGKGTIPSEVRDLVMEISQVVVARYKVQGWRPGLNPLGGFLYLEMLAGIEGAVTRAVRNGDIPVSIVAPERLANLAVPSPEQRPLATLRAGVVGLAALCLSPIQRPRDAAVDAGYAGLLDQTLPLAGMRKSSPEDDHAELGLLNKMLAVRRQACRNS